MSKCKICNTELLGAQCPDCGATVFEEKDAILVQEGKKVTVKITLTEKKLHITSFAAGKQVGKIFGQALGMALGGIVGALVHSAAEAEDVTIVIPRDQIQEVMYPVNTAKVYDCIRIRANEEVLICLKNPANIHTMLGICQK